MNTSVLCSAYFSIGLASYTKYPNLRMGTEVRSFISANGAPAVVDRPGFTWHERLHLLYQSRLYHQRTFYGIR